MKWKPLVIFQTSLRYYVKGGLFFLTGSEFSGMADACFFNFPLSKWEKLMLAHNNKRSRSKMNTFLPSQRFNDKLKLVQCSFSLWLCNILSYISYECMLLNNKCKFDYVFALMFLLSLKTRCFLFLTFPGGTQNICILIMSKPSI